MHKRKVILLTNMFAPYRVALYNSISEQAEKRGWHFKVIAFTESEKGFQWNINRDNLRFDYKVLPGWELNIPRRVTPVHLNRELLRTLYKDAPDVIINSAYDSPAYWQALLYCKLFRKVLLLMNTTTMMSEGSSAGMRGWLKRVMVRSADGFVAVGTKSREYLEFLGAAPANIRISLNTVDMDFFRDMVLEHRGQNGFLQERLRYPECLLVYVGRLVELKGLLQVLRALKELNDPEVGFLIVGSGPQEDELREYCKSNSLQNVYFEGFYQQEKLAKYYALGDIFILPSFQEVWGMVANEALAAGLYLLCSRHAGAAYDLIDDGVNGEVIDPKDVSGIADVIRKTKSRINGIRKRRQEISDDAVRDFSMEKSAKAFVDLVVSMKA